jgi:hypothetical protein
MISWSSRSICHNALDDHVLSFVLDTYTYWAKLDNIVLTWILGTLSVELHKIICGLSKIARQAWLSIEAQFIGNRKFHILQIDAKFCVFKQGDLSVRNYCHKMKGITDDLCTLCHNNNNNNLPTPTTPA